MCAYQCLVCDGVCEPENTRPHPICETCRREGWTVRFIWDRVRRLERHLLER